MSTRTNTTTEENTQGNSLFPIQDSTGRITFGNDKGDWIRRMDELGYRYDGIFGTTGFGVYRENMAFAGTAVAETGLGRIAQNNTLIGGFRSFKILGFGAADALRNGTGAQVPVDIFTDPFIQQQELRTATGFAGNDSQWNAETGWEITTAGGFGTERNVGADGRNTMYDQAVHAVKNYSGIGILANLITQLGDVAFPASSIEYARGDLLENAPYESPLGILQRNGTNPDSLSPEGLARLGSMIGYASADAVHKQIADGVPFETEDYTDWQNRDTPMANLLKSLNSKMSMNFDRYEEYELKDIYAHLNVDISQMDPAVVEIINRADNGVISGHMRRQLQHMQLLEASKAAAVTLLRPHQESLLAVDRMDMDNTTTEQERIQAKWTLSLATYAFGLDHFEAVFTAAGNGMWGSNKKNLEAEWAKLHPSHRRILSESGFKPESFSSANNPVSYHLYAQEQVNALVGERMNALMSEDFFTPKMIRDMYHDMDMMFEQDPLAANVGVSGLVAMPVVVAGSLLSGPTLIAGTGFKSTVASLAIDATLLGGLEAGLEGGGESLIGRLDLMDRGRIDAIDMKSIVYDAAVTGAVGGGIGLGLGGLLSGIFPGSRYVDTQIGATAGLGRFKNHAQRSGWLGRGLKDRRTAYDAILTLDEDEKMIAYFLAESLDPQTALRIMADDNVALEEANKLLGALVGKDTDLSELGGMLDSAELAAMGMTRGEAVAFLARVATDVTQGRQGWGKIMSASELTDLWGKYTTWRKSVITEGAPPTGFIGPLPANVRKQNFIKRMFAVKTERAKRFAAGANNRRGTSVERMAEVRATLRNLNNGKTVKTDELEKALADGVSSEDSADIDFMIAALNNDKIKARVSKEVREKLIAEGLERKRIGAEAVAKDPLITTIFQIGAAMEAASSDFGIRMASGAGTTVRSVVRFMNQYLATVGDEAARAKLINENIGMTDIVRRLGKEDEVQSLIDVNNRVAVADISNWTQTDDYKTIRKLARARAAISLQIERARKKYRNNTQELKLRLARISAEGEKNLEKIQAELGVEAGEFSAKTVVARLQHDAQDMNLMSSGERSQIISKALTRLVDRVDPELVNVGALSRDRVALGKYFIKTPFGDQIERLFASVALWPQPQSRLFRSSIRMLRAGSMFISGSHIGSKNYGKASLSSVDGILAAARLEQLPVKRYLTAVREKLGAKNYRAFQTILQYGRRAGVFLDKSAANAAQVKTDLKALLEERFPELLKKYDNDMDALYDDLIAGDNLLTDYFTRQFEEAKLNGTLVGGAVDPRRYLPDNLNSNMTASKKAELVDAITEMEKELYGREDAPLNINVLVEKGWLAEETRETSVTLEGPNVSESTVIYTVPEDSPFYGITGDGPQADAAFVIKNAASGRGFLRNLQDEKLRPETPRLSPEAAAAEADAKKRRTPPPPKTREARMRDDPDQLLWNGDTVEETRAREAQEAKDAKAKRPKPKGEDLAKTKRRPVGSGRSGIGPPLLFTGDEPVELTRLADGSVRVATGFTGMGTYELATPGLFNIVRAIEFDEKVVALNNAIHGNDITPTNILDVDPADIAADDPHVLHVSPVCKNYSKAGATTRTPTDLDRKSAEWTVRAIDKVRPPIFTLEQVAAYAKDANCKMIVEALRKQGYSVRIDIVDAADWGGASTRKRMILRARRDGKYIPTFEEQFPGRKTGAADWYTTIENLLDDAPVDSTTESRSYTGPSIGKDVDKFLDDRQGVGMPISEAKNIQRAIDDARAKGEDAGISADKPIIGVGGNASKWIRGQIDADSAMGTMTTGSLVRIYMPDGRVIRATPRMLFRLQGIPDTVPIPERLPNGKPVTTARMQFGLGNGMHGNTTRLAHDWMQDSLADMPDVDTERAANIRQNGAPTRREAKLRPTPAKWRRDLNKIEKKLAKGKGDTANLESERATLLKKLEEYEDSQAVETPSGGTASGITSEKPFGGTQQEDATARFVAEGLFGANKEIADLEAAKANLTRLDPSNMSPSEAIDTIRAINEINVRLNEAQGRLTEAMNQTMRADTDNPNTGRMFTDLNPQEVADVVNDPSAYDNLSPAHKMLRHRMDLLVEGGTINAETAKLVLMTYANIDPTKLTGISVSRTTVWDRMIDIVSDRDQANLLDNKQLSYTDGDLLQAMRSILSEEFTEDNLRSQGLWTEQEQRFKDGNIKFSEETIARFTAVFEANPNLMRALIAKAQERSTTAGASIGEPGFGYRPGSKEYAERLQAGLEPTPEANRILLNPVLADSPSNWAARIIVHEAGHAMLDQSSRPMKLLFERMYAATVNNPDGPMVTYFRRVLEARGEGNVQKDLDYALQNVHEFVAFLAEISMIDQLDRVTPQQAKFFNRVRGLLKQSTDKTFTNRTEALKEMARASGLDPEMVDLTANAIRMMYGSTTVQTDFAKKAAVALGYFASEADMLRASREAREFTSSGPKDVRRFAQMPEDDLEKLARLQEASDFRELTPEEQQFVNDRLLGVRDVDPNQQVEETVSWEDGVRNLSPDDQELLWKLYTDSDMTISDNIMRQLVENDFVHTVTTSGAAGTVYNLKEMTDKEIANWIKKRKLQEASEVEGKRPDESQAADYELMRGGEGGKLDHKTRWQGFLDDVTPGLSKIADEASDSKPIYAGIAIIQLLAEFGDELEEAGLLSTRAGDGLRFQPLQNVGRYTAAQLKEAAEVKLWTSTLKTRNRELYDRMLARFREIGGDNVTAYTALLKSPAATIRQMKEAIAAHEENAPMPTPTREEVVDNSPAVQSGEAAALSEQAGKIAPASPISIEELVKVANNTDFETLGQFLTAVREQFGDDAVVDQMEVITDYFNKINPNRVAQIEEWDAQAGTVEPSAAKRELRGKLTRLYAELKNKLSRTEGLPSGSDVRAVMDIEEKLRALGVQDSFFDAMNERYMSEDALRDRIRNIIRVELTRDLSDETVYPQSVIDTLGSVIDSVRENLKRRGMNDDEIEAYVDKLGDELYDELESEGLVRKLDDEADEADDADAVDAVDSDESGGMLDRERDFGTPEDKEFARKFGTFFWMSLNNDVPGSFRTLAEERGLEVPENIKTYLDLIEHMQNDLYDTEGLEELLKFTQSSEYNRFDRMDLVVADAFEKFNDDRAAAGEISVGGIERLVEEYEDDLDMLYEKLFELKAELDKYTDPDLSSAIDADFNDRVRSALWMLTDPEKDEFMRTGTLNATSQRRLDETAEYIDILDDGPYYMEGERILSNWFLAPDDIRERIKNDDIKEEDVPDFIWQNLEQIKNSIVAAERLDELRKLDEKRAAETDPKVLSDAERELEELDAKKKAESEKKMEAMTQRLRENREREARIKEQKEKSAERDAEIAKLRAEEAEEMRKFAEEAKAAEKAYQEERAKMEAEQAKVKAELDSIKENLDDLGERLESEAAASDAAAAADPTFSKDAPEPLGPEPRNPITDPLDTDEVLAGAMDDLYATEARGRAKPPEDAGSGGKPPKDPPKAPAAGEPDPDGVPSKVREEIIDRLLGRGKNTPPSHTGRINPEYTGNLVDDYDDGVTNGNAIRQNNTEYVNSNSANIQRAGGDPQSRAGITVSVKQSAQRLDHRMGRRFNDETYSTDAGKAIAMKFAENMDLLENFTSYGQSFASRIRLQTAMNQLSGGKFNYTIADLFEDMRAEGHAIIRTELDSGRRTSRQAERELSNLNAHIEELGRMYLQAMGYNIGGISGVPTSLARALRITQNLVYSKIGGGFVASAALVEGPMVILTNGGLGPIQNFKNAGTLLLGIAKIMAGESAANIPGMSRMMSYFGLDADLVRLVGMDIIDAMSANDTNVLAKFGLDPEEGANATVFTMLDRVKAHLRAMRDAGNQDTEDYKYLVKMAAILEQGTASVADLTARGSGMAQVLMLIRSVGVSVGANALMRFGDRLQVMAAQMVKISAAEGRELGIKDIRTLARKNKIPVAVAVYAADAGLLRNGGSALNITQKLLDLKFGRGGSRGNDWDLIALQAAIDNNAITRREQSVAGYQLTDAQLAEIEAERDAVTALSNYFRHFAFQSSPEFQGADKFTSHNPLMSFFLSMTTYPMAAYQRLVANGIKARGTAVAGATLAGLSVFEFYNRTLQTLMFGTDEDKRAEARETLEKINSGTLEPEEAIEHMTTHGSQSPVFGASGKYVKDLFGNPLAHSLGGDPETRWSAKPFVGPTGGVAMDMYKKGVATPIAVGSDTTASEAQKSKAYREAFSTAFEALTPFNNALFNTISTQTNGQRLGPAIAAAIFGDQVQRVFGNPAALSQGEEARLNRDWRSPENINTPDRGSPVDLLPPINNQSLFSDRPKALPPAVPPVPEATPAPPPAPSVKKETKGGSNLIDNLDSN